MPLDGHEYLKSQGWAGKGSGLRHGAISRPIMVAQKKTLSGIGKDRDEAFPFWDHVYNVAANAIKVKLYESDSEDTDSSVAPLILEKTSTGILSNRRPSIRTPAVSGTATPTESSSGASGSSTPTLSVMAAARQAAAKRTLYSMFYRGPVLSSEFEEQNAAAETDSKVEEAVVVVTQVLDEIELERTAEKKRKRERSEDDAERKRRKREKKERRRKGQETEIPAKETRRKGKEKETVEVDGEMTASGPAQVHNPKELKINEGATSESVAPHACKEEAITKAERKRSKAERKARKEERRKRRADKAAVIADHTRLLGSPSEEDVHLQKADPTTESASQPKVELLREKTGKKREKKRKEQ